MLKIAIQKSGRLHENSMQLLEECGIEINNGNRQLKVSALDFPLEAYFFRDDDIPQYVFDNIADIGIVGAIVLYVKNKDIDVISKLGFGRCWLSIFAVMCLNYLSPDDLFVLNIVITYSCLLQFFL